MKRLRIRCFGCPLLRMVCIYGRNSVMKAKERSPLFDNMKIVLMILVVFGHALEEISLKHGYGIIRACIYSFHMPAFVFISGYFSVWGGCTDESKKIIVNCGIPYFIFNTIFVMWTEKTFFVNLFLPKYIFWYFFSLLIWRLLINVLKEVKGLWVWALLFGLYIGAIREADRFMSISRIITFFPYFIIGGMMDEERVRKIRRIPKRYAILVSLLMACTVILLHINALVPVKSYENIQCYNASGMSNLQGILIRIFSYGIGFMATLCMINLLPDKKMWYTEYGSRTAVIYVASAFSIKASYKIIKKIVGTYYLAQHIEIGITSAVIITMATILIFGNKFCSDMYTRINKYIGSIVMKN